MAQRIARIMYISDLHKRWRESTSVKGLIEVQQRIQEDLLQYIKENQITHLLIGGDWYDRGYHGLGPAMGAMEMDRRFSAAVNGEVYLCIGNHFYLERDENPEMYIIQPNDFIKPQIPIPVPEKPIFKLVPQLKIGTVQIDFFHYNKLAKNYLTSRDDSITYHVGIYHDEAVAPAFVREMEGFGGTSTQSYFDTIYSNVDLAILGHIHTKIGWSTLELSNGRNVPLFIPGAMCPARNKECEKHTSVQLPILDILDDGNVDVSLAEFSTHLEMLKFAKAAKKKEHPLIQDGLTDKQHLQQGLTATYQSVIQYMNARGYSPMHMKILNAAIDGQLGIPQVVNILMEAQNGSQ